jgi:hypothetical protein
VLAQARGWFGAEPAGLTQSSLCLRTGDAFDRFAGVTGCLRLNVEA